MTYQLFAPEVLLLFAAICLTVLYNSGWEDILYLIHRLHLKTFYTHLSSDLQCSHCGVGACNEYERTMHFMLKTIANLRNSYRIRMGIRTGCGFPNSGFSYLPSMRRLIPFKCIGM